MSGADKSAGRVLVLLLLATCLAAAGCEPDEQTDGGSLTLNVPRGYVSTLEIEKDDRILGFGPFVGYYFRPAIPDDLRLIRFVCFNERSFYTTDVPENAKLYEGSGKLVELADVNMRLPEAERINPVYFADAPPQWLKNRPEPKDEYVHFHSCYDVQGPVSTGYWLRHEGAAAFTYDMGGRVGPQSPLYHRVKPGIDKNFARIIEFDRGPE